jgi:hypothetical protein
MPITSTKEMLDDAFSSRYGIGAFNIVNNLFHSDGRAA